MPFVQRVVSPTFLSRSRPRSRVCHANGPAGVAVSPTRRQVKNVTIVTTSATGNHYGANEGNSAGSCSRTLIIASGNTGCDQFCTSSRDIIVNGTISSAATIGSSSTTGKSGSTASTSLVPASAAVSSIALAAAVNATSPGVVPLPLPLSVNCPPSTNSPLIFSPSTTPVVTGHEFESVTNITLSNALRQLASLVLIANDIFSELNRELQLIGDRSKRIKERCDLLEVKVEQFDPKLVPVPESDLETFVHITDHFKSIRPIDKELFTPETRSTNLRQLYDAAAKTPISCMREFSDLGVERDPELLCTPVLGQKHRKMRNRIDVEIETRLPAAVEELRKWTSTEALGDITVTPDCVSRVVHNTSMNNSTFYSSNINGHHNGNLSSATATSSRISSRHQREQQQQQQHQFEPSGGISIDVPDDNSTVIAEQLSSSSSISNSTKKNQHNEPSPGNRRLVANEDDDLPLDHRLPSPEEQCLIIAKKFPAELVTVDITGRRFERMCIARKSMINYMAIGDHNNLNDDVQTVKRRSRSRKPRGKRRNTIAGTDQREIEEAANGEASQSSPSHHADVVASTKVGRSKSSDILKKDSPSSVFFPNGSGDSGKTSLTRFGSLKQWGRSRLRWMQRGDDREADKENRDKDKDKVLDIDDNSNVTETVIVSSGKAKKKSNEKERKLSHERKPSYSSSEKSLSLMSSHAAVKGLTSVNPQAASINPVKMRESSSLRRQRRSGADHKDEPHSSSGNWSASSESGRTSIGSEITVQPKSSASSTSLNHSNLHSGSGPPSSIISRRRFLNTSASSSVTSEGTATPDLQVHDLFYDDETSSAYSCDTEGYYTSFHVDSGLKTLKEEEPMTPLHSTSALSSTTSFSSTINQTVLTAESEYELFGRGSTSTTTSSAGTVCTTLMAIDNDKTSMHHGPAVPERKSSLTKLNRSNSNASNCTLERSYSSSTVGSTLERTGTIKRNGVLIQKEVAAVIHQEKTEPQQQQQPKSGRIDSPDSGNNTSSSPIETNSNESPTQGPRSNSEFEYSECSDLEGVERIERIRVKTTINSSRIPSMCIITPTTSDDETMKEVVVRNREKLELPEQATKELPPPHETDLDTIEFGANECLQRTNHRVQSSEGYAIVPAVETVKPLTAAESRKDANFNNFRKTTLQPLNTMLGKLKGVLPHLKKSPNKDAATVVMAANESLYDTAGEYVTIADVRNNNNTGQKRTNNGIYYSNDIVKRNLATVLSGNLNQETEYVSLNELPCTIRCDSTTTTGGIMVQTTTDEIDTKQPGRNAVASCTTTGETGTTADCTLRADDDDDSQSQQQKQQQLHHPHHHQIRGARVTFDSQGKVVYNSDSLKRRKGAHTTFAPGPCVKDPTVSAVSSSVPVTSATTTSYLVSSSSVPSAQCKPIPRSPLLSGGLTRKQEIIVRPVVSQKVHITAAAASQNVDMATDVLSGRYVRENAQSELQLDNGNHHQMISTPAYNSAPQYDVEDYRRLNHNEAYQSIHQLQQQQQQVEQQRFIPNQQPLAPEGACYPYDSNDGRYSSVTGPGSFQRNNQVYWTLQHRRQPQTISSLLSKDDGNVVKGNVNLNDLYATPNKIRNREGLRTTPFGFSTFFSPVKTAENEISPIDPRNVGEFKTSTPSKLTTGSPTKGSVADELRHRLYIQDGTRSYNPSPSNSGRSTPLRGFIDQHQPRLRHSWAPETPELPKTCSDRLGTQKTSLMDFKKLLLAKSSKTTPTKVSAVELLKLKKKEQQLAQASSPPPTTSAAAIGLNTSMNILELSGSPKTFANRRMLRPGNYGSPSKTVVTKPRTTWRMNATRTDVMSTAIPEANSEEDGGSSGSNNSTVGRYSPKIRSGSPITSAATPPVTLPEKNIIDDEINFKTNIFLQAEENNFMKGEAKPAAIVGSVTRSQLAQARAHFLMNKSLDGDDKERLSEIFRKQANIKNEINAVVREVTGGTAIGTNIRVVDDCNNGIKSQTSTPSLETAL